MQHLPVLLILLLLCSPLAANRCKTDVTGIWSTKEPGSREPQLHIRVFKHRGRLYARIIRLLHVQKPPQAILHVNGEEKKRPLIGTTIFRDLVKKEDAWAGGRLLDPNSGSEYRCRVWRVGGHLKVRGYQFIFYKTFTWFPALRTASGSEIIKIARRN